MKDFLGLGMSLAVFFSGTATWFSFSVLLFTDIFLEHRFALIIAVLFIVVSKCSSSSSFCNVTKKNIVLKILVQ